MSGESKKYDYGKPRMDLLPFDALEDVAEVLTYGAEKYGANTWRGIEVERYEAALLRHLAAFKRGEAFDPESGLSHVAHIATNALFMAAILGADK